VNVIYVYRTISDLSAENRDIFIHLLYAVLIVLRKLRVVGQSDGERISTIGLAI